MRSIRSISPRSSSSCKTGRITATRITYRAWAAGTVGTALLPASIRPRPERKEENSSPPQPTTADSPRAQPKLRTKVRAEKVVFVLPAEVPPARRRSRKRIGTR